MGRGFGGTGYGCMLWRKLVFGLALLPMVQLRAISGISSMSKIEVGACVLPSPGVRQWVCMYGASRLNLAECGGMGYTPVPPFTLGLVSW